MMSVASSALEIARQVTRHARRRVTDEGDAFCTFRLTLHVDGPNRCLNTIDTDHRIRTDTTIDTSVGTTQNETNDDSIGAYTEIEDHIDIALDTMHCESMHLHQHDQRLWHEFNQNTMFFSPEMVTQSQAQSIETRDDVCDLYDNTVLSTPHADTTAMSVPMHLTAEFGSTVTQSLLMNTVFTPAICDQLIAGSTASIANRHVWITRLNAEVNAIDATRAIADEVLPILMRIRDTVPTTRSSAGYQKTCQRLDFLMSQIDDAITNRQVVLDQHRRMLGSTHGTVSETLYQDCPNTRPVFQTLATIKRMLQRTQANIANTEQTASSDSI
ncbi:DUF7260 family protein [Haloquadratum walsbyi]|jgi:hypothetical protein|uniref:DUF7260 domain-containing protein n=1 Tax=Haloquadratum walsbyi (strain DSM 16790 / HBSQ001) TaxID=362976 RepID=Q18K26_HALWD|nr:hypothetical protein [Haloquadratum walsbyi]CAJ51626.1 uncharacterized protein HQ_1498A [Haloquadratum walsbyi DSM 16790]